MPNILIKFLDQRKPLSSDKSLKNLSPFTISSYISLSVLDSPSGAPTIRWRKACKRRSELRAAHPYSVFGEIEFREVLKSSPWGSEMPEF